jgi:H+/Cl- antiporter ClcA
MLLQLAPVPPVRVTFAESPLGSPHWWLAWGTAVLALVTAALAWYTARLFRATREAREDSSAR